MSKKNKSQPAEKPLTQQQISKQLKERFKHRLKDADSKRPDTFLCDVWERGESRDIYSYIIFEEDGTILFHILDDDSGGDSFGSSPSRFLVLTIVEAPQREAAFKAFVKDLPEDEQGRREALAKAFKKYTDPYDVLDENGIDYNSVSKSLRCRRYRSYY